VDQVVSNELGDARTRDFDATVGPWIEPGYRLAVAMLRDPEEAHDAVQEATVKAWRALDRLRDSGQARACPEIPFVPDQKIRPSNPWTSTTP